MAREVSFSDQGSAVQVSYDAQEGLYRLRVRGTALLLKPDEAAAARDELAKVATLPRGGAAPCPAPTRHAA